MSLLDVLSAGCLIGGALACLFGAIGLVSFPDVLARLQAATKPQTLGLLLIMLGTGLQLSPGDAAGLVLVGLFQALTAPVLAQLIGRAAYRSGSMRPGTLVVDELGERLERESDRQE